MGNNYLDSTAHVDDDFTSGCHPVQPWELNSFGLISWFTVLQFSANAFFWCGASLRSIRADCLVASAVCVNGAPGFAMMQDIDDRASTKALQSLVSVESEFRKIGLLITAQTVSELAEEIKDPSRHNFQWLYERIEAIESLGKKELQGKLFLYIPPERSKFWPKMSNLNLFGDKVASQFPSTTFDIRNSGVCLATTMSTAAVFHLMRVLEIGLSALGSVFGVSMANTNWEPAIREIESKIRDMHKEAAWKALPDCKEQQEFYSQAASHFGILKDAWRNYTMHARGKYTEEEAELIFQNVKGFMNKLAERLHE